MACSRFCTALAAVSLTGVGMPSEPAAAAVLAGTPPTGVTLAAFGPGENLPLTDLGRPVLTGVYTIGPGALNLFQTTSNGQGATLDLNGANLALPASNADFSLLFGLIPARATISLTPVTGVGPLPVTGNFAATGSRFTFQANLHLDDLSVFGFSLQGLIGPTCATSAPMTVTATSGGDPRSGAALTGTYAIPAFAGCAGADPVVSGGLSGPGNTINLKLG